MKYLLTYNESNGLDNSDFFKRKTGDFGNQIMDLIKKNIFTENNCKLILDYSGLDISADSIKPISTATFSFRNQVRVSKVYKKGEVRVESSQNHSTDYSLIEIFYGKSFLNKTGNLYLIQKIKGKCAYLNNLGHKNNNNSEYDDVIYGDSNKHADNSLYFSIRCRKHNKIEVEFSLRYLEFQLFNISKKIEFNKDIKNKNNFLLKVEEILHEVSNELVKKESFMSKQSSLIKNHIFDEITKQMNSDPKLAETIKKYPNMYNEYTKETGIKDRIDSIDMGFYD
jgi:hypothetical protein